MNAVEALSGGVWRKLPARASSGAKAMAWGAPSTVPHRLVRSATSAAMCDESLMSSSSTSGSTGRRSAARLVSDIPRPKPVSTISAPCSWAMRAVCHAIESSVSTPVINSRLPWSSTNPSWSGVIVSGRSVHVGPGAEPEAHHEEQQQTPRQGRTLLHLGAVDVGEGEREQDHEPVEHVEVVSRPVPPAVGEKPERDLHQHRADGGEHGNTEEFVRRALGDGEHQTPHTDQAIGDHRDVEPVAVEGPHWTGWYRGGPVATPVRGLALLRGACGGVGGTAG